MKYRVTGDVRHAFTVDVEADNADDALELVEQMHHSELDMDTSNSGTDVVAQTVEGVE